MTAAVTSEGVHIRTRRPGVAAALCAAAVVSGVALVATAERRPS